MKNTYFYLFAVFLGTVGTLYCTYESMLCIGLKSFHPTDYTVLYLQIANQNYLETDVNVGENVHLVLYYNPVGFLKKVKEIFIFLYYCRIPSAF